MSSRSTRPDKALAGLLDDLTKKQARRRKPTQPTAEDKRQAEKRRQAQRTRVIYDLPEDIIRQIKLLAASHQVPEGQLVALLLRTALEKGINIDAYKIPSTTSRYKFMLEISTENES